jgi:catechol 2,3-dioxygenase-like lactoylglutathione lyase family enzyme
MLAFDGLCPLLQVFDMPTSLRFYRDVLGFEVVDASRFRAPDDADWVWLRHGRCDLMLNTAFEVGRRPESLDRARREAHRDATLFLGCEDLDGAFRHLRSHGVEAREPVVAPYGMRQLSFSDPDGYGICLQWPAA